MSKTFQAVTIGAAVLGSTALLAIPANAQTVTSSASYSISVPGVPGLDESLNLSGNTIIYVVQTGDTLSTIAAKYCTSWQSIYDDNENVVGPDPDIIQPGEKLTVVKGSCDNNVKTTTTSSVNYVSGTPQQIAWSLLPADNRAEEFSCLDNIIMAESSWDIHAYNPSGAYGIPQALPGWKMAGPWGMDWENSAYVQLYWMIRYYIPQTYGTACDAWAFHLAHGWY